jgi:hypothetical protein
MIFYSPTEVLSRILNHPFERLCLWNEDKIDCLFGHLVENGQYCQDQIVSALDLIVLRFCLHSSKEEKVACRRVWAIGLMRYCMGTKFGETFTRLGWIVGTYIVQMHWDSFQRPYSAVCAYVVYCILNKYNQHDPQWNQCVTLYRLKKSTARKLWVDRPFGHCAIISDYNDWSLIWESRPKHYLCDLTCF